MKFHKTKETLEKISELLDKKETGAYYRFGDGDLALVRGIRAGTQAYNADIKSELIEKFKCNDKNVLKCLPIENQKAGTAEPEMVDGNHARRDEEYTRFTKQAEQLWGGPVDDVYSMAALHYQMCYYPEYAIEFLKKLKGAAPRTIFVGNQAVPDDMIDMLFGEDCLRTGCIGRESWTDIDKMEKFVDEHMTEPHEYTLIVTAAGPAGRALQHRIWKKHNNMFLFCFGSAMDAICGWANLRGWIRISKFDHNSFIEKLRGELQ